MSRVERGVPAHAVIRRGRSQAKAITAAARDTIRIARQAVEKAGQTPIATGAKKRNFRSLWIQRITLSSVSMG